jgi:hypothetical protein
MNVYHNTFLDYQEPDFLIFNTELRKPSQSKNEDAEKHQPRVANSNPNLAWCFKHTTS